MVRIRPATDGDTEGIRRVATASYRAVYTDVLSPGTVEELLDRWYSVESVQESIAREDSETFVAEDDGVVGFASAGVPEAELGTEDPEGVLGSLYVHPERWGEGTGRRLVERAECYLGAQGAGSMRIAVFAENDVGTGFYEGVAERIDRERHEVAGEEVRVEVYRREFGDGV